MHLTRFTDQSLRCLMYLARIPGDTPTMAELAAGTGLTEDIVLKVVRRLIELGYVTTIRGRSGGVRLNRQPAEINLGGRWSTKTEANMNLVSCYRTDSTPCPEAPGCQLAGVFCEALGAFLTVLDSHTLQDVLGTEEREKAGGRALYASLNRRASHGARCNVIERPG